MKYKASLTLTIPQVKQMLCESLAHNGIEGISTQDIDFIIENVTLGDQRDPYTVAEVTKVKVNNITIGE